MDYDDDYGYGGVQLSLTRASEDGNYLNPSKLYYNTWMTRNTPSILMNIQKRSKT